MYGARITLYIVRLVTIDRRCRWASRSGTAAGYFGGWVDTVLMRITDIFISFPNIVLALAFAAALGPGVEHAVIAISMTAWPPIARLAEPKRCGCASGFHSGASAARRVAMRILVRHIWPLCFSSVIVRLTLNMAGVILTVAGLGFLGLGAQPPTPEWGSMISVGPPYMLDAGGSSRCRASRS